MRKTKKRPTRRQKARRWCLAALGMGAACLAMLCFLFYPMSVSYTHLTLPTN